MPDPVIVQPEIVNPVIKAEDEPTIDLLKMAQDADYAEGRTPQPAAPEIEKPAAPEVAKVEDSKPKEVTRDEVKIEKPESAFTKKQKEEARKEKTWQEIQARREDADRREAALAQRERELQQRQATPPQVQPEKYSSKQLFGAADQFLADARAHKASGNHEEAAESAELATQARIAGQAALEEESKAQNETHQKEFTTLWQKNAANFQEQHPETKDPNSEISQKLIKLFDEEPMLNFHPEGLRKGYELLQLREKGAKVGELEAKVATLEKEIARLRGATQLSGAPPAPMTTNKTFDDLSIREQSQELGRLAEEADQQRVA